MMLTTVYFPIANVFEALRWKYLAAKRHKAVKKVLFEISQNSHHKKAPVPESLF